jgi:hypothetical protein
VHRRETLCPNASFSRNCRPLPRACCASPTISFARDLETVVVTAREAARELTGADGVSIVLRSGTECYCVDEEAIAPPWKGRRFPLDACVAGRMMTQDRPAVIADIYADSRVPVIVQADAPRLEQVFANLLRNAAKYTDPGTGRAGLWRWPGRDAPPGRTPQRHDSGAERRHRTRRTVSRLIAACVGV